MDAIVKFFKSVVGFLESLVSSIVEFIGMAKDSVTFVTSFAHLLPSFLGVFIISLLAVYVIKLIVGR